MLGELREGTILFKRRKNIWNNYYEWEFVKVKKITETGKIRLTNEKLLNSLEGFRIFNAEAEQIYIQDRIKEHVRNMIVDMERNINNIIDEMSIEKALYLGNVLEELKIENVKKWSRESTEKYYNRNLEEFKNLKKQYKN